MLQSQLKEIVRKNQKEDKVIFKTFFDVPYNDKNYKDFSVT